MNIEQFVIEAKGRRVSQKLRAWKPRPQALTDSLDVSKIQTRKLRSSGCLKNSVPKNKTTLCLLRIASGRLI